MARVHRGTNLDALLPSVSPLWRVVGGKYRSSLGQERLKCVTQITISCCCGCLISVISIYRHNQISGIIIKFNLLTEMSYGFLKKYFQVLYLSSATCLSYYAVRTCRRQTSSLAGLDTAAAGGIWPLVGVLWHNLSFPDASSPMCSVCKRITFCMSLSPAISFKIRSCSLSKKKRNNPSWVWK